MKEYEENISKYQYFDMTLTLNVVLVIACQDPIGHCNS